jgi:transposase
VVEKPFIVTEYHCHTYTCSECQGRHTAAAPKKADSGLFSIGLIALAAYLKGRCHVSFRALKGFFHDVLGIVISGGFLAKQIKKASGALKRPYTELEEGLKGEMHLYVDESGWKENGEKRWIWAFRAKKYAVFIIRGSRGETVLEDILGKAFKGIISCDFYGACRKFQLVAGALLQFCRAHLTREVLFLLKLQEAAAARHGRRMLKQTRGMFETTHKRGETDQGEWKQAMRGRQEKTARRALFRWPNKRRMASPGGTPCKCPHKRRILSRCRRRNGFPDHV